MPPLRNNTFVNNITQDERPDPIRIFLFCLLFVSILIGASFYALSFYFSYKSKMALGEIVSIEKRLETLPLDNMLSLSKKINTLDSIQKSEANIPLFLGALGDSVEKDTYMTSMSYANKGKNTIVKLVGTSNSYEEVVKQMDKLKNIKYANLISKVDLVSISATDIEGVKKVLFSLDISIDSTVKALPNEIEEKEYTPTKQIEIKKDDIKKEVMLPSSSTSPTLTSTSSASTSPSIIIKNL